MGDVHQHAVGGPPCVEDCLSGFHSTGNPFRGARNMQVAQGPVKVTVTVEADGYSVTTTAVENIGSHSAGFKAATPGSLRRAGIRALNHAASMVAGAVGDDEERLVQLAPKEQGPAEAQAS